MSDPEQAGKRDSQVHPVEAEGTAQSNSASVPPEAIDGVLGRYKLCYELARGGMATVFLARMVATEGFGKVVALKCIHPHLADEPEFVQMFLDEARLASRISHPNVCSIIDFGNEGGTYYLALEFLLGEPLGRLLGRLKKSEKHSTEERVGLALHIIAQAAEGLHAAHELRADDGSLMNVVHRDVSPQNIFLTYQGGVSVLDFGVAAAEGRMHETEVGRVKGKFAYMSPEQIGGSTDRRSDVWSLGVCLWELLTVRKLFGQKSPAEQVRAATLDPIPTPSSIRRDLPKSLDPIVMKALSRDPDARYSSAREFGLALVRYARENRNQVGIIELAECMNGLFAVERGRKEQLVELARRDTAKGDVIPASPDLWQTQLGTPSMHTGMLGPTTADKTVEQLAAEVDRLRADVSNRRRRTLWLGLAAALILGVTGFALYRGPLSPTDTNRPETLASSTPETVNRPTPQPAVTPTAAPTAEPEIDEPTALVVEAEPGTNVAPIAVEDEPDRGRTRGTSAMRENAPPPSARRRGPTPASRSANQGTQRNNEPSERTVEPTEAAPVASSAADTAPSDPPEPEREANRTTPPATPEPEPQPETESETTTAATPTPPRPPTPAPVTPRPAPPPVLDATVSIGRVSVARGSLPAGDVSRAAARAVDNYRNCYRSGARRAQRDASGAVTLRFEVDTRGRFRRVQASSFALPGVSSCVAQATEGLRTRRAPDTGTAQTTMQVRFTVRRR